MSPPTATTTQNSPKNDDRPSQAQKDAFLSELPQHAVEPLWTVMSAMVPPFPNPKAIPHLWNYEELRPLLIESSKLVNTHEAERRVLMLINPACKAPQTTDTLYAGLQLINPGETAPAHRHVAFALRFIIEGDRGFTAVEGEKIYMKRGDVILTPSWTWHDHGHEGDGPMIWLDGLDLPIYQSLPVNFAEMYAEPRYPSEPVDSSPISFPWEPVQKALDANKPEPYGRYLYQFPGGQHISKIIGAHAERIQAGTTSPRHRETSSFVFHVYQGRGYSLIGDGENLKKLVWREKDTFAVPHWSPVCHVVEAGEDAYLFSFSDRPLMEGLNQFRDEKQ